MPTKLPLKTKPKKVVQQEKEKVDVMEVDETEESQIPSTVPKPPPTKPPVVVEEKGPDGEAPNSLDNTPEGKIGKILVYKSGLVKLKIGNYTYDVFYLHLLTSDNQRNAARFLARIRYYEWKANG